MAGSPPFGKISTGMRWRARTAHSAIAISATTTVMGRVSAANTRRIASPSNLYNEGLNIARGRRNSEQTAPDPQPRESVIDLGLGEQALRIGYLVNRAEPGLVTGRRLLGRGSGGG